MVKKGIDRNENRCKNWKKRIDSQDNTNKDYIKNEIYNKR